ncbi:hypothetical protein TIFTF001_028636 [Ficus carica]|uniref:Uncharacterized protein n=1 Tax=Ficus carica TaxID=3494 RepID=A0AA88J238_FICCA|nr:hypothetical protein TIFTF001_028636 [Ficus carica]
MGDQGDREQIAAAQRQIEESVEGIGANDLVAGC